jgi:hypothetical protein
MHAPLIRFRNTRTATGPAQPPLPHLRRRASVVIARTGGLPPIIATLVLVQSVARGDIKTALTIVVALVLLGVLAFAIFLWPRFGDGEKTQWEAPLLHSQDRRDTDVTPQVQQCEAREQP